MMMIATKPMIILAAAAGGHRRLIVDLPDPPLAPNGEPQGADSGGLSPAQSSGFVLLFLLVAAILVFSLLYHICNKNPEPEEQQQNAVAAVPEVAVDMVMEQEEAEAALDCRYKAAEPWEEGTCSVCLAELEDGEALKMLMPCMHYFHTACLDEWLRKSATCPICRRRT